MANRNFPASRIFGMHLMPVRLDGTITIGAAGAVSSFTGAGIKAVTHTGTGAYVLQLQDNYASLLTMNARMSGTATGSAADPHGQTVGTVYQITTVGNTDWVTAGIPAGITPAVGMVFALLAQPATGTGRAKLFAVSGVNNIQMAGNPNLGQLNNQPFNALSGGFVTMICIAPTSSSVTTPIATDPASGEVITFELMLNNSQIQ